MCLLSDPFNGVLLECRLRGMKFADKSFPFCSNGSVMISAVDEKGNWQAEKLGFGDIWYFPKGVAHAVQGLEDDNEFLLV